MNNIQRFTSQMRMTGFSGLDTDSIVSDLMKVERLPLDTLRQKRTILEWKQTAYREISSSLMGFKSKFFDIVNRSSYLLSTSSVKAMSAKSSNSDYVTATASAGAVIGENSIKIVQLATADRAVSSSGVNKGITGTIDEEKLADVAGKKIFIELDGVSKQITLNGDTAEDFVANLHDALDAAFGKTASGDSKFTVDYDSTTQEFSINTANGATKVTVYGTPVATEELAGLNNLGLKEGESNRLSLRNPLINMPDVFDPSMFDEDGNAEFKINGETITFKSTDTLEQIFSKINNNDKVKATIGYDEVTDKITITSKITGSGDNLVLSDSGFFKALNLETVEDGKDAVVEINGQTLIRSTNNFTVNGITYTLKKAHEADDDGDVINVSQDTDSVINNIKSFIEEYNKIIDTLRTKTTESYDRNYLPLTDEQKDAMSDKDIEKWEEKAKTGLLRNDSLLQQIALDMRKALYEKVEGVGISLKDLGIESKSYADYGKLYLDEDKLKNMLISKPDEVAKLLNGVSAENPTYSRTATKEQRADRYNKSGVFQRLSDIIEDSISTYRDADGRKGTLLEKAGIAGDLSNTKNLISDELDDFDDRIDDMIYRLTRKEEAYYKKFSQLETMLAQMNQQSSWIASQFGMGQQ
jgi:flagellar hook-associated protein 2